MYLLTGAMVLSLAEFHAAVVGFYDFTGSSRFGWSIAYIALLCLSAYGVGLPDLPRNAYQFMVSALGASVAAAIGISMVQLILGSQLLPRFVVFWSAVFLVPVWALTGFVASRGRRSQIRRDRVVLVASDREALALEADLERRPERRARLISIIRPKDAPEALIAEVRSVGATVVVLAREALSDDQIVDRVAELHEGGIRVRTLSLFYDEWLGKLPLTELERVALMFDIGEIHRARYGRLKRAIDFLAAVVLLPALVASVPPVIFGNMLLGNRGPLFFRQERVGRAGARFTIVKFRTMRAEAQTLSWTADDDPRVTRFGRMLRKTHVDELPQLLNVLRGDLSLVGPRPEQVHYVDELSVKIPFYRLRHLVRPGVTGWAQVKYDYGASEQDAMEKLQYEFWYLRHQSLTLDLRIIGRTLRSVIGGEGR